MRPQNRNLKPPFKSGHPPVPGAGRPRGVKNFSVILREQMEQGKITQAEIVAVMLRQAKRGNLRAIELIMTRMDGKPNQPLSMSGADKPPEEMTEAELNESIRHLEQEQEELGRLNSKSPESRIKFAERIIEEAKQEIVGRDKKEQAA
jgi:hypothetical protein